MKDKERYIKTLAGVQIELAIFVSAVVSAYGYAWMSHMKINDTFIVVMLRSFIIFADLGMFLAIGYMVDFKRGVVISYVYKVLAFLQTKDVSTASEIDFLLATVGKAFGLVLYYKLTLFLIIYTASYIVEIDHEQTLIKKQEQEQEEKKLLKQQNQQIFSQKQRQQLYSEDKPERTRKQIHTQTQKTIKRIKLSLRYHKQDEFYKKLEIFFFVFYNSVCILTIFPLQEYVLDFSKALSLSERIPFFQEAQNLLAVNQEVIWYVNFQTVWNVVMFWLVILIGEFKIKTGHPEMIKKYLLGIPSKFILMQTISLVVLVIVLVTTPISLSNESLKQIYLIDLINYEIFGVAFMIHTLLPLFICFLLLRLYLGQTYYLNRLVSRKFSFHQNSEDGNSNLDGIFYECIIQDDINKVRHFIINPQELLSRHKLKRYTDEQRLRHYVDEPTILQVQSLFQDFMVLDLYNKLSRYLSVWMFYIGLGVFLVSLNVNDTYFVGEDQFFVYVPSILLWVGIFFVFKYESTMNVFYPKVVVYLVKGVAEWLVERKAYNFIRLMHFYAIVFGIWLYRVYSEWFLPTHRSIEDEIKQALHRYYSSQRLAHTSVMSQLLSGWSKYFTTQSSSCDYDVTHLVIDSVMILLIVAQMVGHKYTYKKGAKGDGILLFLKLIAPVYAMWVFVINMECIQWGRATFCISYCLGVAFMHVNQQQVQRGILRNDQQQMKQLNIDSIY